MSLKQAIEARKSARESIEKTKSALARGDRKITELGEEHARLQKQLEVAQTRIALDEAEESEADGIVAAIAKTQAKLDATKSGLDGIVKRLASDDQALQQAKTELARTAVELARPIIEHGQAAIREACHSMLGHHAAMLRLLKALAQLSEGKVSLPADPDSWSTQDFTDRILDACRAHGLARVRTGVDVFHLERGALTEGELLELLAQ